MATDQVSMFNQLQLSKPVMRVLDDVGYETPSPIQALIIPLMAAGKDVVGQAQTGTGKTAAFALPILSTLDIKLKDPQVLVLAPTRELAIQVAEAFQKYAKHIPGFHVIPVYGGQDYRGQIRALKRGVHVVVGIPGRVMDHMRKGTLKLGGLKTLVLDEADKMLRMGFIDDVEWILEQIPAQRQIALFSATMPTQIRRIANKYLCEPEQVTIKVKTTTAETIRQRFWMVKGVQKLDALTRILEAEEFDAMIVFVRTKTATLDLADKLQARGHAAVALNGDIAQNQRERTITQLKNGKLDILVATDVAARGLDVERVSHVVNYDIPYDTEAYVHRIGRTGRAGRQGDAILFVTPRERRLLSAIEKATRKKIEIMQLPTTQEINNRRIDRFKQRISKTLESQKLPFFTKLIEEYESEHDKSYAEIAAALAFLAQADNPILLSAQAPKRNDRQASSTHDSNGGQPNNRGGEHRRQEPLDSGMERFRVEVGHAHQVKPGNIVGAIANEAGLDGEHIGRINIQENFSLIDLPEGMPKDIFRDLQNVRVAGKKLAISRLNLSGNGRKKRGFAKKPAQCKAGSRGRARNKTTPKKGQHRKGQNKKNLV